MSAVEQVSARPADRGDEALPDLVRRRTFTDEALQAEFARVGFVKVHLLDDDAVDRLRAIYDEIFPETMSGFIPTYAVPMPERKAQATARVKAELEPVVAALFDRHRAFNSSFLMKWPGDDSALPLHQDVTYVNEQVFRTAVAWVALDDADDELDNGPLQVVPGSHRFDHMYRGTHTWWPYGGVTDFLEQHCLVSVPVRRGDVLIMDNALIHCSFPNRTDRPRLAVALAMAPEEAGLLHAVGVDDGTIEVHDVDDQFFVDHTPYTLMDHGLPDHYPLREVAPLDQTVFDEHDLEVLCGLPEGTATASRADGSGDEASPSPEQDEGGHDAAHDAEAAADEATGEGGLGRLGAAVVRMMTVNNRLVGHAVTLRPVYDPHEFAWPAMLEERWEEIRDEARAVLETRRIPRIEEVLGAGQGNQGDWNTFVLLALRHPVEVNAGLCPVTSELVARVPGINSALFSVFQPGTHLPSHQAHNRGVLRYHLGLIVPDPPDSCQLRVLDDVISYREGESILFDDTFEHEAWNRGEGPRVTLLLEVDRPLRAPYHQFNRLTQRAFAFYPEARGAAERVERLDWELNGGR